MMTLKAMFQSLFVATILFGLTSAAVKPLGHDVAHAATPVSILRQARSSKGSDDDYYSRDGDCCSCDCAGSCSVGGRTSKGGCQTNCHCSCECEEDSDDYYYGKGSKGSKGSKGDYYGPGYGYGYGGYPVPPPPVNDDDRYYSGPAPSPDDDNYHGSKGAKSGKSNYYPPSTKSSKKSRSGSYDDDYYYGSSECYEVCEYVCVQPCYSSSGPYRGLEEQSGDDDACCEEDRYGYVCYEVCDYSKSSKAKGSKSTSKSSKRSKSGYYSSSYDHNSGSSKGSSSSSRAWMQTLCWSEEEDVIVDEESVVPPAAAAPDAQLVKVVEEVVVEFDYTIEVDDAADDVLVASAIKDMEGKIHENIVNDQLSCGEPVVRRRKMAAIGHSRNLVDDRQLKLVGADPSPPDKVSKTNFCPEGEVNCVPVNGFATLLLEGEVTDEEQADEELEATMDLTLDSIKNTFLESDMKVSLMEEFDYPSAQEEDWSFSAGLAGTLAGTLVAAGIAFLYRKNMKAEGAQSEEVRHEAEGVPVKATALKEDEKDPIPIATVCSVEEAPVQSGEGEGESEGESEE